MRNQGNQKQGNRQGSRGQENIKNTERDQGQGRRSQNVGRSSSEQSRSK